MVLEALEDWVHLGLLDLLDLLDLEDLPEIMVVQEHLVVLVKQGSQALQDQLEFKGHLDQKDP